MVIKLKKKLIFLIIITLITILLIIGSLIYIKQRKTEKKALEILSSQEIGEKVINFINKQLKEQNLNASLINVIEESGVYKIEIKINEEKHDLYITKDGKLLFTQILNLEEIDKISRVSEQERKELKEEEEEKEEDSISPEKLESLAKCLNEKGAKFYGSDWCGWCKKQKEIFDKASQYLPYIECSDKETKQITSQCQKAGINAFPTWEFNGQKNPGFKTIQELSTLSGCLL